MPLETQKRKAKRDKLYSVALEVMSEQGFSDATVEEITQRADTSRSVFYYYFDSKADLIEQMINSSVESLFRMFDRAVVPNMGTRETLLALARTLYATVWKYPDITKFVLSEMWHPGGELRSVVDAYVDEPTEVFSDLLEQGQEEGVFDPTLNIPSTSRHIFLTLCTTAVAQKEGTIKGAHDVIARQTVGFIFRGIACDPDEFSAKCRRAV